MIGRIATLMGIALLGLAMPAAAQTVLNINTALTTDDPMYAGLERMKTNVEKRTAGKLQIRIFPGSQLGKDEDVLEPEPGVGSRSGGLPDLRVGKRVEDLRRDLG